MKKILSFVISIVILLTSTSVSFAHVVVTPSEVGVSQRQNFVVGVPTEGDNPTVSVRLIIPEGLKSVSPLVKPGWNIQIIKTGEGESERVSEIVWSGGNIPAEQRDEFVFRAQAPAEKTNLVWKAYQTYAGGDIVAWDTEPKVVEEYTKNNPVKDGAEHDHDAPKPYSQTIVINDLASEDTANQPVTNKDDSNAFILSVAAILLSAASIGMQFMKKK